MCLRITGAHASAAVSMMMCTCNLLGRQTAMASTSKVADLNAHWAWNLSHSRLGTTQLFQGNVRSLAQVLEAVCAACALVRRGKRECGEATAGRGQVRRGQAAQPPAQPWRFLSTSMGGGSAIDPESCTRMRHRTAAAPEAAVQRNSCVGLAGTIMRSREQNHRFRPGEAREGIWPPLWRAWHFAGSQVAPNI